MSRGTNLAILIGHIGNDPETKYTQGGTAVTKISLATTSVRKDRDGNQQEKTEWHRVTFFGKLAEIAGEYLRKGSQVYIQGRISYSESTGDDGQKRYFTDIIADEMQMLGGRGDNAGDRGDRGSDRGNDRRQSNDNQRQRGNDGGGRDGGGYGGGGTGHRSGAPNPQRRQTAQQAHRQPEPDYLDDDIPFLRQYGVF